MTRVAVVGAGMSGLVCSRELVRAGFEVKVFDKARGPGGRMATRRTRPAGHAFDHGAQYFTVRAPELRRQADAWLEDGVVAAWKGRIVALEAGRQRESSTPHERFVGVPRMSALTRHLATSSDLVLERRITELVAVRGAWLLRDEHGETAGPFDRVVVSAPGPQAAQLLQASPPLAQEADSVRFAPCWAAMLAFEEPLALDFDGAFVHGKTLSWIARDSSKPERSEGDRWVLHGSPDWSEAQLELEPEQALAALTQAFAEETGLEIPPAVSSTAHRWRFALPLTPLAESYLYDPSLGLGACGDWCAGPRVEGAFLSGLALAGRIRSEKTSAQRDQV